MPGDDANIRASDADRARVADDLRAHCTAGRITIDELEERVGKAMAARTYGELREITADLPAISAPSPDGELAHKPTVVVQVAGAYSPGIRPFTMRVVVPAPLGYTRNVALETIAPGLNGAGFELATQSTTMLEFHHRANRTLAIVIAVLLFPIGLLALRAKRDERVVISLEPEGPERTAMIVHGRASSRVRQLFAELTF